MEDENGPDHPIQPVASDLRTFDNEFRLDGLAMRPSKVAYDESKTQRSNDSRPSSKRSWKKQRGSQSSLVNLKVQNSGRNHQKVAPAPMAEEMKEMPYGDFDMHPQQI